MEPITGNPDQTYSIGQIIAASTIVIGMCVGSVAFVAAPDIVSMVTSGAVIGFVASRALQTRRSKRSFRPHHRPEPTR